MHLNQAPRPPNFFPLDSKYSPLATSKSITLFMLSDHSQYKTTPKTRQAKPHCALIHTGHTEKRRIYKQAGYCSWEGSFPQGTESPLPFTHPQGSTSSITASSIAAGPRRRSGNPPASGPSLRPGHQEQGQQHQREQRVHSRSLPETQHENETKKRKQNHLSS